MLKRKILKFVETEATYHYSLNKISSPEDVFNLLKENGLHDQAEEFLFLITLDTANQALGIHEVSHGTVNASVVHPREVYKRALLDNATSIILAHNHPSGVLTPSNEDKDVTELLFKAGEILKIKLQDHVVVSEKGYKSFKEIGLL